MDSTLLKNSIVAAFKKVDPNLDLSKDELIEALAEAIVKHIQTTAIITSTHTVVPALISPVGPVTGTIQITTTNTIK